MSTVQVHIFCEGDLEEIVVRPNAADARGFADGVTKGANFYGAGSCAAFVIPGDEDEMRTYKERK